jgi:hypothetical protein
MGTMIAIVQEEGKVCSCQILLNKNNRFDMELADKFFNMQYEMLSGPQEVL